MIGAIPPFVLIFAACAVWVVVTQYIGAAVSGWSELARRFPDHSRDAPSTRAWAPMNIGSWPYSSYAGFSVDRDGLHVVAWFLYRFACRPFVVPWETVDRRDTYRVALFGKRQRYSIGFYTTISLPQRSDAARMIDDYLDMLETEAGHR
jgi:hypothetical protein